MTTTMLDPRLALWDRRAVLKGVLAKQRAALAELGCGCSTGKCGANAAAHAQLLGLIHKNAQEIDAIEDLITDHPTLGA